MHEFPAGDRVRHRQEQTSDLQGSYRYGQSFLTWTEVSAPEAQYRVYRSPTTIVSPADLDAATLCATLGESTSVNVRETLLTGVLTTYVIRDGDPPLVPSQGLYVRTSLESASAYYAVTAIVDGVENREITPGPGGNSLSEPLAESVTRPLPVRQFSEAPGDAFFTHWVDSAGTPLYPAMANAPGRAFTFHVQNIQDNPPVPQPLLLRLHPRNGSYREPGFDSLGPTDPLVLTPDDPLPLAGNSFWYGYNSNFLTGHPLTEGRTVDYTQRRLLYYLDWALAAFPLDPARVHVTGQSMGAVGAIALAAGHPDRFASAFALLPKVNFRDTLWAEPEVAEALWGSIEENIPTPEGIGAYDRLDAGWMAQQQEAIGLPVIALFAGRRDSIVGWHEKPSFFRTLEAARMGGFLFWDQRGHGTANHGFWDYRIELATGDLLRYRLDRSFPAISGLDLNGDPGDGDPGDGDSIGTIGGFATWETETIVDFPNFYEVTLLLTPDAPRDTARAEVTPRRLQAFDPLAGEVVAFATLRLSDSTIVQRGNVAVDSLGLITVPHVLLSKEGSRLRLRRTAVGVGDHGEEGPSDRQRAPALGVPHPNPFGPEITIPFTVGGAGEDPGRGTAVELRIYSQRGRLVRTLFQGILSPGPREVVWDKRDGEGRLLPSGVYLLRLSGGGGTSTRRVTLLR